MAEFTQISNTCLQAPVGYDKFSYAWRSRKGTVFNDSNGKHFCTGGYKQGDVLGFYIFLPDTPSIVDPKSKTKISDHMVSTNKDLPLIKFKNYFYYEEKDEVQQALKNLKILKGSKIVLYKNGVNRGVAFNDLYRGTYYPAVSIYKNATVRVNFGPTFRFPPKDLAFEPMSYRAEELVVEQVMADMLFFIENEGKLTLDARQD
uniref:SPRY domain-containing protein n=1 Tax=Romanomermis culicivorax TaxID=13658 RepID=A0A915JYB9_ROMCU